MLAANMPCSPAAARCRCSIWAMKPAPAGRETALVHRTSVCGGKKCPASSGCGCSGSATTAVTASELGGQVSQGLAETALLPTEADRHPELGKWTPIALTETGIKTDDAAVAGTATWSNVETWRDTSGQLMKMGEGNVLHAPDGLYYMYGNRYTCVPNNESCFGKVFGTTFAVYSSPDLQTWTLNTSCIFPQQVSGPWKSNGTLHGYSEPVVLYNKKYDHYVLWFGSGFPASPDVHLWSAVSESPIGPFVMVLDPALPHWPAAGQFPGSSTDFWVDSRASLPEHEAWMHHNIAGRNSSKNNGTHVGQAVTKLTDDFRHTTSEYVTINGTFLEGGAVFERHGQWYMMAGTPCCLCDTGASAEVFMAPHPLGPWRAVGNIIAPVSPTKNLSQCEFKQEHFPCTYEIRAQQFGVLGLRDDTRVYVGQRWGSAPLKCHDGQYWGVLEFDEESGVPLPLRHRETETVVLPVVKRSMGQALLNTEAGNLPKPVPPLKLDDSVVAIRSGWSPLAGLPPLPKPHHSWLSSDPTFASATDPLTRDVVRITGSCPVYACFGDSGSCHAPSHPCSNDTASRAAVEACVALATPVNATIAINYSPWYCIYRGNDPTTRTKDALADTARELQLWSANLGKIKSWLGGRAEVGAVLLDSEKFECGRPNPAGCSNQTVLGRRTWAAIDVKHDHCFNATKAVFPHASVEFFSHGGARFRGISTGSFTTTSAKFSLRERSDTFSTSLHGPSELGYTRETYARSVVVARNHNISSGTPWIALGSGYDRDSEISGEREFVNSLEYPLAKSWMLGRDINVPAPPTAEASNGGDWAFAQYAMLFPDVNNSPCEAGDSAPATLDGTVHATVANSFKGCSKRIQDSTLALLHFTAFVLGANCIQELPNRTTATKRGFSWGHVKPGPILGGCFLKTDDPQSSSVGRSSCQRFTC